MPACMRTHLAIRQSECDSRDCHGDSRFRLAEQGACVIARQVCVLLMDSAAGLIDRRPRVPSLLAPVTARL
ncbi:hypothetical protein CBOM_07816 [Ceraceosorus bombacis]|uniref:Uncharacterized protein n=1 Tax=Ceraceosorus bombacis TaxID=401625 RepID=A0A0P1BI04_9BASI|nr:hypothetical protein CBOM_07816 [Ceraceosorus bombacis]